MQYKKTQAQRFLYATNNMSARAQADILRLYEFLASKDPVTVQRAVVVIKECLAPLQNYQCLGHAVDESNLRELTIDFDSSGYSALYEYIQDKDVVVIVTLEHQSEDDYK